MEEPQLTLDYIFLDVAECKIGVKLASKFTDTVGQSVDPWS